MYFHVPQFHQHLHLLTSHIDLFHAFVVGEGPEAYQSGYVEDNIDSFQSSLQIGFAAQISHHAFNRLIFFVTCQQKGLKMQTQLIAAYSKYTKTKIAVRKSIKRDETVIVNEICNWVITKFMFLIPLWVIYFW